MKNNLPIGTIVKLKEDNSKTMIAGLYCHQNKKLYTYIGVKYPYGNLAEELVLYFNDDDIEDILFIGNLNYKGEKNG